MKSEIRNFRSGTSAERRPIRTIPSAALCRGAATIRVSGLFAALVCLLAANAPAALDHFITARGDQLMEGDQPFRFISWNIPNLHYVEDNMPFAEVHPLRFPDRFEVTDALATTRQMGGTVVRTYVLAVRRTNDTPADLRHVLGPGQFNEAAFRTLDLVLQVANEQGVRVIVPFVDNWIWWGGIGEYAGFRGKPKDAFWTDPQVIADFKETVRFVVLRTNTLTGVRYCDDKAILCWETGNELTSPPAWTREIAAYLKSLDKNHLVMDGYHTTELRAESLDMPEVDIVTTHHYPGPKKSFAELIRANWARAKGRKPYVVGEFGFVDNAKMAEAMEAIKETGVAGGLMWSLRFRNRDGGFYWHSEPLGGNQYKAFHWPGSTIGAAYDEIAFMNLVRLQAFAIRGLTPPPIPVPEPPKLLPVAEAAAISWQGSVGASAYVVERAAKRNGPWTQIGNPVDESFVQYRPLFVDESATAGKWYYRVCARNSSGTSKPSNVSDPVKVTHATFVDELADFTRLHAREGNLEIRSRDCRQAKEDAHRVRGESGAALIYRIPTAIAGFRVFAFFPREITDPKFAVSADGQTYREVTVEKVSYYQGAGDYGYWKPVLYQVKKLGANGPKFFKLTFTGETQVGRVEITRAFGKS
jgi:mannan endo-1,4-beta-mannosidase